MALFTDTHELDRQGRYNAPDLVEGPKAAMLAALGYKNTGQANQWGKFLNMMPGVAALGRNELAGGLSKGTDTNKVIKGQRGAAFNDTMAGIQLGVEGVKLAAGLGNAGGVSSLLGLGKSGIGTDALGAAENAVSTTQGADMVTAIDNTANMQKTEQDLTNELKSVMFDENGNPLPNYSNYVGQEGDQPGSALANSIAPTNPSSNGQSILNGLQKANNILGKVPMIGGVAKAVGNNLISGSALNAAGTSEYNKLKQNSTYNAAFSYL